MEEYIKRIFNIFVYIQRKLMHIKKHKDKHK